MTLELYLAFMLFSDIITYPLCKKSLYKFYKLKTRGSWVAHSVQWLPLAQVLISGSWAPCSLRGVCFSLSYHPTPQILTLSQILKKQNYSSLENKNSILKYSFLTKRVVVGCSFIQQLRIKLNISIKENC